MKIPENLLYTKDHEWVAFSDDTTAKVGITDFAQSALGDIVFVTLPEPGDETAAGKPFAEVESVKAVSEVFCPVGGTVAAVNDALNDAPESVNGDPYGAWMAEISGITAKEDLLDAAAYAALCAKEA